MEAPPSPSRLLAALRGGKCGNVWFDPAIPRTDGCFGWHWCKFGPDHDGPHVCRGCETQPAGRDGPVEP